MKISHLIIALLFTPFIVSCEETDSIVNLSEAVNDVQETSTDVEVSVKDGILHFLSDDAYFEYGRRLLKMPKEERRKWEEARNFTSLLTFAENVMDEKETDITEAANRPEFFTLDSDSTIEFSVPLALASIANKDGYLCVEDRLCKVDKNNMAVIENGGKTDVDEILKRASADGYTNGSIHSLQSKKESLKAASTETKIRNISTSIRDNNCWMDYSIRVYLQSDTKTPTEHAIIVVEQKSKNYKKKRRRWREHRCSNVYRGVKVYVSHPSLPLNNFGFHEEWLGIGDYYGKSDLVNHSYHEDAKEFYRGKNFEISNEEPFFTNMVGTISSDDVYNSNIDLTLLFSDTYKKLQ